MKTKTIVHKSAAPIYAAAVTWVLYALLFPLYHVGHFLLAAAAAAAVALIARIFCRDVTEEVEVPEEPVSTGNVELDRAIAEGDAAIKVMRTLNDSIQDAAISAQIDRLETVSGKIFGYVKERPEKLPQIRRFMDYYLPTTLKLLRSYDELSRQGVNGENISGTMEKVEGMMGTIVSAFEKLLDSLFGEHALDISTDITVLDNLMAREGLTGGDALHRAAQESPAADPVPVPDIRRSAEDKSTDAGDGITLEL